MKKHLQPLTPAALYARANGYLVASEPVDGAESGRVADRPQFRRMIEEGSKPSAPFGVIVPGIPGGRRKKP